jgi:hypothetical protein
MTPPTLRAAQSARTSVRLPITVLALVVLALTPSGCSFGRDEVPARDREKQVLDTVSEAVPLVEQALGARKVRVGGGWSSCPSGLGHEYSGGGTITAPEGDEAAQLDAVRSALTDAGFEDGTLVDGHVSVSRGEVGLDFHPSPARGPGAWKVSFSGPCKRYGGDDKDYVKEQDLAPAATLFE